MERRTVRLLVAILVGVIAICLAGCATGPTSTAAARTMPQMLQEAGFKVFSGDAAKQTAYMQNCSKNTLMIHTRGAARVYCYVDQATNTMYHGDEAAHQRLQTILKNTQQSIREQRIENDPVFWDMWASGRGLG